jgi:hypothetical protein
MTRSLPTLIFILGIALLSGLTASQAHAQFPPSRFYGVATLNGQTAQGATVIANIGSTNCGSTTTDASGSFRFDVLASGQRSGCGSAGSTVTFTVNGANAPQTGQWESGGVVQINLTASTSQPSPVSATPTVTATVSNNLIPTTTAATQPSTPQWLDRPLATSAPQSKSCPSGSTWSFLYWGGPNQTPIGSAAAVCPSAETFWAFRGGKWLGYATQSAAASDSWTVFIGDASFIRGR